MSETRKTIEDVMKAAEDKVESLSAKADRAGKALDALSRRIDDKADAVLSPKEGRK